MAKALELNTDSLTAAQPVPRAAKVSNPAAEFKRSKPEPDLKRVPLQVRWSAKGVKSAKLAAIQLDFPTVSEFMLVCFHAYMKSRKQPR